MISPSEITEAIEMGRVRVFNVPCVVNPSSGWKIQKKLLAAK